MAFRPPKSCQIGGQKASSEFDYSRRKLTCFIGPTLIRLAQIENSDYSGNRLPRFVIPGDTGGYLSR